MGSGTGPRWSAGSAALCAEGEACNLSVPVRGTVTTGAVRLQAGAGEISRTGSARLYPTRTAADWNDGAPDAFPDGSFDLQVCPAREIRRDSQRASATYGQNC